MRAALTLFFYLTLLTVSLGQARVTGQMKVTTTAGGSGAITLVTTAKGVNTSSASAGATVATTAFAATTGNFIFVAVRWYSGDGVAVSDTAGNTYVQIDPVNTGTGTYMASFYVKNIIGNASNVVTATLTNGGHAAIYAAQYSGLSTTAPLDAHSTGFNASGTSVSTGTFTTTVANEVMVAVAMNGEAGSSPTAGSGYTLRNTDTTEGASALEDQIVTSIQTSVTASMSGSGSASEWLIVAATFK